mmetsp:Transcript_2746/g.6871  ORF Transcript_2746/g.6871 Transcript_2746/m.6871 type:complete len:271 (-) Transcript_2746:983-1795(-)
MLVRYSPSSLHSCRILLSAPDEPSRLSDFTFALRELRRLFILSSTPYLDLNSASRLATSSFDAMSGHVAGGRRRCSMKNHFSGSATAASRRPFAGGAGGGALVGGPSGARAASPILLSASTASEPLSGAAFLLVPPSPACGAPGGGLAAGPGGSLAPCSLTRMTASRCSRSARSAAAVEGTAASRCAASPNGAHTCVFPVGAISRRRFVMRSGGGGLSSASAAPPDADGLAEPWPRSGAALDGMSAFAGSGAMASANLRACSSRNSSFST